MTTLVFTATKCFQVCKLVNHKGSWYDSVVLSKSEVEVLQICGMKLRSRVWADQ